MPAPSQSSAIQSIAGQLSYGSILITISDTSDLATRLANGIVNGWGTYPTGMSSFQTQIVNAFSGYLQGTSEGMDMMIAIGSGLDGEWQLWVNSWSSSSNSHSYAPTKASVESSILAAAPNVGTAAYLADKVSTIFSDNFVQEGG